jgi:cation diffusion facilitator family transporter
MPVIQDNTLIKSASYISVFVACGIVAIKMYGWFFTESQSLLASLVDSILDISSSLINLLAIHFVLQPPDHNHRFGHEKFQDLTVFSQSIFFFASSLFTLSSSVKALFFYTELENVNHTIYLMYLCSAITFCLVCYQTYVLKKTQSQLISIDRLHYVTDFLMNIAVIISIKLSSKLWCIDSLFGIAISLYIGYFSLTLFKQSIKNLADEEFEEVDRKKILHVISNYKEIKGVHELKTRYAASKPFIQFHLEMDGNMSLYNAHIISENITNELLLIFKGGEVTIHQDPADEEECVNYREVI